MRRELAPNHHPDLTHPVALGSRGIRANQVDEDLVQGRLLQLELRQPRART